MFLKDGFIKILWFWLTDIITSCFIPDLFPKEFQDSLKIEAVERVDLRKPLSWKSNKDDKSIRTNHFTFFFLWPCAWHMGIPKLGVDSELQLRSTPQLQQHQIQAVSGTYVAACSNEGCFNPLSKTRDRTCILMETMLGP